MTDSHATRRARRTPAPPFPRPLTVERLLELTRPDPNSGCRLWTRGLARNGYAVVKIDGRPIYVHRIVVADSYGMPLVAFLAGAFSSALQTRHTCNRKRCIEPLHLLVGTRADNARDRSLHRVGFRYTYVEGWAA